MSWVNESSTDTGDRCRENRCNIMNLGLHPRVDVHSLYAWDHPINLFFLKKILFIHERHREAET